MTISKENLKEWIKTNWFDIEDDIEQMIRSALSNQIDIVDLDFLSNNLSIVIKQDILTLLDDYNNQNLEVAK